MEIKKMPLEEKYDKLLDEYLEGAITNYALLKELGAIDKNIDLSVKVQAKMLPSLVGIAFKVLKTVAPGTAFNQLVDKYVYTMQMTIPLSDIELNRVSDREATVRVKNCPVLKRVRTLVEKTGLDIEPKSICELESRINQGVAKEFGVSIVTKFEENGCINTAKLK
jgi:hypothetical protein